VQLQRAFKLTGALFLLPPGTPKDRVEILKEAFRKIYRDREFHKKHKKLTGEEPTPLMPEDHERTIREIPRKPEVICSRSSSPVRFRRTEIQTAHGGAEYEKRDANLFCV
jgi:hypothetical protein